MGESSSFNLRSKNLSAPPLYPIGKLCPKSNLYFGEARKNYAFELSIKFIVADNLIQMDIFIENMSFFIFVIEWIPVSLEMIVVHI